jgi:hypothetical protein
MKPHFKIFYVGLLVNLLYVRSINWLCTKYRHWLIATMYKANVDSMKSEILESRLICANVWLWSVCRDLSLWLQSIVIHSTAWLYNLMEKFCEYFFGLSVKFGHVSVSFNPNFVNNPCISLELRIMECVMINWPFICFPKKSHASYIASRVSDWLLFDFFFLFLIFFPFLKNSIINSKILL